MTFIKLPENTELVYKKEICTIDCMFEYTFRLARKYSCQELGMWDFQVLNKEEKKSRGVEWGDSYASDHIPEGKLKCVASEEGRGETQYNFGESFGAAASDEYIKIRISVD